MHSWEIMIASSCCICTVGIIGNTIAFCTFGKMHTQNASTVLIRALAFVDSCLLLTTAMLIIRAYVNIDIYIVIAWCLAQIFRTASIWTPVLVGVHRYIVVCKPLAAASICTASKARWHFGGVLAFSLIVNIPVYIGHLMGISDSPWLKIVYDLVFLNAFIMHIIPVVSLLFVTTRLVQLLHFSRQRRRELSEGQRQGQLDRAVHLMVIVVLIVFILCHTSIMMCTLSTSFWLFTPVETMGFICDIIFLLNSSVNCIIYIVFNLKFRPTLWPSCQPVTNHITMTS